MHHVHLSIGATLLVLLLITLHLFINLPKPPSLHPIAAFGTYVMIPIFYMTALAPYCWAKEPKAVYLPVFAVFIVFFLYLPYIAFKVLPPWHQKTAEETVFVESAEPLISARPKAEIFPRPESLASAEQLVLWCLQCQNAAKTALLYSRCVNKFIVQSLKQLFENLRYSIDIIVMFNL